jgi:hypothetical protein
LCHAPISQLRRADGRFGAGRIEAPPSVKAYPRFQRVENNSGRLSLRGTGLESWRRATSQKTLSSRTQRSGVEGSLTAAFLLMRRFRCNTCCCSRSRVEVVASRARIDSIFECGNRRPKLHSSETVGGSHHISSRSPKAVTALQARIHRDFPSRFGGSAQVALRCLGLPRWKSTMQSLRVESFGSKRRHNCGLPTSGNAHRERRNNVGIKCE